MRQVLGKEKLVAPTGASGVRMFGWVWLVLLLATGFLVSSCGNDDNGQPGGGGPTGPVYTAEELNEMGWDSFTVGDYYDAWDSFSQAVAKNGGLFEARLGLGWAQAYTGRHAEAVTTFQELVAGGRLVNDARAGLAAAALFTDPVVAEQAAKAVLGADEDYVFSRRTTFNSLDLHMILAEAYFAQQQYNLAQVTADLVAQMNGLPASGLDPLVPGTWVVEEVM